MSGRITLWGAGELLSSFLGKKSEPPTDFYLAAIGSVPPTPYVSGAELNEPVSGGYARLKIPNTVEFWSNLGQIQVSILNADVQFAPATGDWGTMRYWALCNAAAEGFVYFVGSLDSPVTINNSDILAVGAGDLGVTVGPFFTTETA